MNLVMGLVAAGWLVVVSHEENEHPSVGHLLHKNITGFSSKGRLATLLRYRKIS